MQFRVTLPALIGLASFLACSTGPDDNAPPAVEVEVGRLDLEAQLVRGTIRNIGGQTLTTGDCMAGLESGATGTWVRIPREGACDMWGGWLPSGKSVQFVVALPSAGAGCPLRVAVGLGVDKVPDQTVTGHSSEFCPEAV